ncbi:hypothetical protein [Hoyosella altamirensis]|uniref:Thioesterase family protein n=1 Tax=Hoyosella altamirensis TaxID=616997 RepID=A0A839RKT6_9ACTN|nr:hypothetical protein [Hoyosella altamirensis]MBB3036726.1 hypothetical protein [Hoyosella altamirensis]
MTADVIRIDPRFCGPSDSGNGGYVSGLLAAYVEGPARVRLKMPPPLNKPLTVDVTAEGANLRDGDQVVATATPATVQVVPPSVPSMPKAIAATQRFRGNTDHRFPRCFVCGPERAPGDGLRIFPGPVEGRDLVAAPWVPEPSVGEHGLVKDAFIWAALDCPGGFAVWPDDPEVAVVLGELAVRIDKPVHISASLRVIGWPLGVEGRKRTSGTAIFDYNGEVLAVAEATWIAVPAADFTTG